MPLIDLKTNLKSLKWGNDRPGGGSSGQPYIQKEIDSNLISNTPDFVVRGGLLAPLKAKDDVERLSKFFLNPLATNNGPLFIAKQNLLSKTSVKTEASKGINYGFGTINGGVFTPVNQILQAGSGFTGVHFNRIGVGSNELERYEKIVTENNEQDGSYKNRLISLLSNNANKTGTKLGDFTINSEFDKNFKPVILSYQGGPGSNLGIGKTIIKRADKTVFNIDTKGFKGLNYSQIFNKPLTDKSGSIREDFRREDIVPLQNKSGSVPDSPLREGEVRYSLKYSNISNFDERKLENKVREDFRKEIYKNATPVEQDSLKSVISLSPSYTGSKRIEDRVYLGDPGKRKDVYNYNLPANDNKSIAVDKINALNIYSGGIKSEANDLVKFRITDINAGYHIHFRAFIDSFDDSTNSTWNPTQYIGRGDKFWNYQGFDSNINMSFTVAAQSKRELIPMFKRLNYLKSLLAPDYSAGFMKGNLVKLTMGGYLYEMPGFITSLNYSIPQESPWEIGITNDDSDSYDSSVKELPHIIKVTGLTFTPIYNFKVQRVVNPDKTGTNERYISLSKDSGKGNYNDEY